MTITIIRSIIIYISVILAVRILGKRQIGELSPHEFVITMLISAVATVPLEENSIPLTNSLFPILVFVSLEIIESLASMKSKAFRTLIQGRPIYIIKNGKLMKKEMEKLRLNYDDLKEGLREQGAFDVSEVENAIVETNGTLSVQKQEEK